MPTPSRCSTGCAKGITSRTWSAAASAICCSAAGPKDFDIGTSAHPAQVKKLFRNCWIIGRRFRLAHVKFGAKVIEVATFRRQLAPGEEVVADGVPAPDPTTTEGRHLIHHDNTFGTPEEDAFRRDFTINALSYNIATFSIIDYVGGLEDLQARVVRSIGDPQTRIHEDPVRMLRAVALASRIDFAIDPPLESAIRRHRHEIAKSSPPRLDRGVLQDPSGGILGAHVPQPPRGRPARAHLVELHRRASEQLWRSLAELDTYRRKFESTPDTLTNPILLGSLIVPLGIPLHAERPSTADAGGEKRHRPPALKLGELPLARGDVDRLRQILSLQRRLRDTEAHPRAQAFARPARHLSRSARLVGNTRRARWISSTTGEPSRPICGTSRVRQKVREKTQDSLQHLARRLRPGGAGAAGGDVAARRNHT